MAQQFRNFLRAKIGYATGRRGFASRAISLQLDYFMSAQFAGVAVAKQQGLYQAKGIELNLLPECPPGLEPQRVREHYDSNKSQVCVGTIEQNILVPVLAKTPGLNLSAVASMFEHSPLGLAALPSHPTALVGNNKGMVVGAHVDTVDLLQNLLPDANVVGVPRDEKMKILKAGEIDAVQVYDVMETLMLEEELGQSPRFVPLHMLGANLGYSQVIFVPNEALEDSNQVCSIQDFLSATFEGWKRCISDPGDAAKTVMDLQADLGVQSDHWINTLEFTELTVRRCCDYVKATSCGGRLGVIESAKWGDSQKWLSNFLLYSSKGADISMLNSQVWKEDSRLMHSKSLANSIRTKTRTLVKKANELGVIPSLAVITVGKKPTGGTHEDAARRLQLYSPLDASWFSKSLSGKSLGIHVEEITLPENVSTADLVSEIQQHKDKDGIQLMWPLPDHIDSEEAYHEIEDGQDVDGAHYIGRMETAGGHDAVKKGLADLYKNAPVTPLAVVKLLSHYGIDPKGQNIVIIGRSRIVGQPLAYMLTSLGGLVTIAHSEVPKASLIDACKAADIVIPCAGFPGLVEASWIKPGAVVVNVGTTFANDALVSDITDSAELESLGHAKLVSTCPGGVGPLSVAVLFENVANNAILRNK